MAESQNGLFDLRASPNTALLPASDAPRLVYLLVEIVPNAALPAQRAPVDLTLVVDASNSMLIPSLDDDIVAELLRRGLLEEMVEDGIPIFHVRKMPRDLAARAQPVRSMDFVQQALRVLADRLGPEDRFSLVGFAGRARTLIAKRGGRDKAALPAAFDALAAGDFGDDTCVAPGVQAGIQAAQQGGKAGGRARRMLLLTDGFAADEEAARAAAQEAARAGLPLSTVGLGLAFNEGFLIGLAEMTGGNAHLVFKPEEIPVVFQAEFEATQRVLLENLALHVTPTPGVELRRVHRVRPAIGEMAWAHGGFDPRGSWLLLGTLERDQPLALLLELVFPPRAPGTYRAAKLRVTNIPHDLIWTDEWPPHDDASADVVLTVAAPGTALPPPDPRIMNLVETVGSFRLQTRALQELAAGDVGNATRKLEALETRLLQQGEAGMAASVREELDNLAQQGQMSAAGTKKLTYETRRLTQKLG